MELRVRSGALGAAGVRSEAPMAVRVRSDMQGVPKREARTAPELQS